MKVVGMEGMEATNSIYSMQKRVAIYCRVSTMDQSTEMQRSDLRRYCEQRGVEIFGASGFRMGSLTAWCVGGLIGWPVRPSI
jgi:predicted site-specific integrase-resolvase